MSRYERKDEEVEVVEELEDIVEELSVPPIGKVVECEKLNVRESPSATADVVTVINKGLEVMIDEDESTYDFYKIYTETSIEGFCMKQFIAVQS